MAQVVDVPHPCHKGFPVFMFQMLAERIIHLHPKRRPYMTGEGELLEFFGQINLETGGGRTASRVELLKRPYFTSTGPGAAHR